tara:strand:- start:128 stop:412 length:285 start_codon:yes stop_codon:yes gene_type:complete
LEDTGFRPVFEYNKSDASCRFCNRKHNPHPDFDEPIVVTQLPINNEKLEICINCYFELEERCFTSNQTLGDVIREKENLVRILGSLDISGREKN